MRFRKLIVYVFTALFLAVAVFFGTYEAKWHGEMTLTAVVTSDGQEETISCWQRQGGEYVLFLPSYAQLSDITLYTNVKNTVRLNGQILTDGMSCQGLERNTPYELSYEHDGKTYPFTVTLLQSEKVATLYVDVASGSMDYIHQSKGNAETGTVRTYSADGKLDYKGNMESLKGRGSSTWMREKKPYSLTLYAEGDLLGMGAAQEWILLANDYDPSNLRNKMVYDFAQAVGLAYSPDCRWVDLYLNGEYAGVYLLCERNEVHPQRVALEEEGSFLVSKEWEWRLEERSRPYIMTESNAALRIHYADIGQDALEALWQSAENAILAEDGIDPVTGKHWTELIDLDSWAKKYLIEELFGNVDASTLSQYFYRDGEGKICAGPVWDYDLCLANPVAGSCVTANMFYANRDYLYGSKWYCALYEKEEFYDRVVQLYETRFRGQVLELLDSGIAAYTEETAGASAMNRIRWGAGDAGQESANIREYLSARVEFLDSVWLEGRSYLTVCVLGYDGAVSSYALQPGETLPGLETYESNETTLFYGWFDYNTDQPFDVSQPIWEDTVVYLKYENK